MRWGGGQEEWHGTDERRPRKGGERKEERKEGDGEDEDGDYVIEGDSCIDVVGVFATLASPYKSGRGWIGAWQISAVQGEEGSSGSTACRCGTSEPFIVLIYIMI